MDTKSIKLEVTLDCLPQTAFNAWLDSKIHGQMVGANAKIDPKINGKFSIWDGELTGKTIEIDDKDFKIVQQWRSESDNWDKGYYTNLTVEFKQDKKKTKLVLVQTGIPAKNAEDIKQGWKDFYFKPMQEFFSKA